MSALPAAPVLTYSFTSFSTNNPSSQQPGVQLDAQFNLIVNNITATLSALGTSLNADGTLNTAAVQTALAALGLPTGNTTGDNQSDDEATLATLAADLAQGWAEWLPGPLPASLLANTEVTGDHYSSRYWANQAAVQVQAQANALAAFQNSIAGQIAQGEVTINTDAIVVPITPFTGFNGVLRAFALVNQTTGAAAVPDDAQEIQLILDGVFQRPGTDFTVAGSTLTFTTAPPSDATCSVIWIAPGQSAAIALPTVIDGGAL